MNFHPKVQSIFKMASFKAIEFRHEFVTPEHLLIGLINDETFVRSLYYSDIDYADFVTQLDAAMTQMEKVPKDVDYEITLSEQTQEVMDYAQTQAIHSDVTEVGVPHLVDAILKLEDSTARHIFVSNTDQTEAMIVSNVLLAYEEDDAGMAPDAADAKEQPWRNYVTCINEHLSDHNPLIGREAELERTIQVLCRKDKNNPLHIGESGVGKTALIYGLAAKIERGEVPERLMWSHIYSIDLASMLAGSQFRGDFEKRMKSVMEGISAEENAIVYIDEVHNLVGAGRGSDGAMDASNMLKPYLETGRLRFIGSTTYQEYNRHLAKSRGIVRRFQQIDIAEPSIDETVEILKGLRGKYEEFHSVRYTDDVLRYAVEMSHRHISDRFLPDKAIDLIDEAGAMKAIDNERRSEAGRRQQRSVSRKDVNAILSKVCKIDAKALSDDNNAALERLSTNLKRQIYGQDEAIDRIVEAVQMSKAGLLDADKPIASMLFVGPTGVGKTEVARVLAAELGIELVRFDMSEYTEKHTVAKLIGSPAGYVGYEDGGLLTDAIRKSPNCVLLLDEIEKAHSDIYNILLQVMDYARLTDNRGQKADFHNVILIMTSNAGAQYAAQASIGFSSTVTAGEAMLKQVKRTFKPEFINRLSSTVVFNDMDMHMALLILDKKLRQLSAKLAAKDITLTLAPDAHAFLLQKGFTRQYGAREMDRIIQHHLNPMLMREILFGRLKKGGRATVVLNGEKLELK